MKCTRPFATILILLASLTLTGLALARPPVVSRDAQRPHAVPSLPAGNELPEHPAETLQEIDTAIVEVVAVEPESGWPHAVAPVAAFLELDEVQTVMLVQLLQQRRIAAEPYALELKRREAALAVLLQSVHPDPSLVGQIVLEIRQLHRAVAGIQIEFLVRFRGLLDQEQLQRLAFIRAAVAVQPVIPAFVGLHLI